MADNPYEQWAPDQTEDEDVTGSTASDENPYAQYASKAPADDSNPYAQYAPQSDQPQTSAIGAGIRSAAREALPTAGALTAGVGGAGFARAAAEGANLGKFAGPIGAVAGGVLGGFIGGAAMSEAQRAVMDILGLGDIASGYNPWSKEYQAADEAQHPLATKIGSAVPILTGMAIDPAAGVGQRVLSGGLMGASDVGQQLVEKGKVDDPASAAISTAAGVIAPTPRAPLAKVESLSGKLAGKLLGGGSLTSQAKPQTTPGTPGRPDINADAAADQTNAAKKEDIVEANDLTLVPPGVAQEQTPVRVGYDDPDVVGNPEGQAGMLKKTAAKPSDPTRNLGKQPSYATGEGDAVTTGQVDPATQLALKTTQGQEKTTVTVNGQTSTAEGPGSANRAVAASQGQPAQPLSAYERKYFENTPVENVQLEAEKAEKYGQTDRAAALRAIENEKLAERNGTSSGTNLTPQPQQQEPDVTAPVTNEEGVRVAPPKARAAKTPKVVRDAITLMRNSDHPNPEELVKQFTALSPETQKALAERGKAQREQNRPTIEGVPSDTGNGAPAAVQVRDKADAERKQAATDAIKKVYPDLQAITPDDPQAVRKFNDIMRAATAENKGVDPIKGYPARQKSQEYQLLNAARKAMGGKAEAVKAFHALNNEQKSGLTPQLTQETDRINADIELNPRTGIDTEKQDFADNAAPARIDFEPALPDRDAKGNLLPNQDRMHAQNDFQDWLAGLSDKDYAAATHGFDVEQELRSGSDPKELKKQMITQLADDYLRRNNTQPKVPPVMEPVPAEDATGTPKPIANRADLAEVNPVRRLDPTSPEGREIAKAALERANANVGTKAEQRAATKDKIASAKEAGLTEPAWKQFIANDAGHVKVPVLEWMQQKFDSLWSPDRAPYAKEYSKSLGDEFNTRANKSLNLDMFLRDTARSAPNLTEAEWRDMDRAYRQRKLDTLPQKLQDVQRDVIQPLIDRYNKMYDHVRTLDPSLDLPMRKQTISEFAPQTAMGKTEVDNPDVNDPIIGKRGLTNYDSAVMDRNFFALDDGKGTRKLLRADKFDGQAGDKVKDKSGKVWEVDHALPEEIARSTDVHYHENPLYNWSRALRGVENIRENLLEKQRIANDKRFLAASTTNKELAEKLGYVQTKMTQFQQRDGKDLFMDKRIAYVMDDFAQAGFDDWTLQGLRNMSTGLAKVLYTFGPIIHMFNEADLWTVGRGFDWLTPGGMRSLGVNGFKAIKSVSTQDDLQTQIRALGGNPMLAGSLTRGIMGQIAKKAGIEIAQNPSKWDPLARTFGISTSKIANGMYNQSTKGMWWLSDVLLTQRVLENMDLRKMSMTDAIKEAHEFISDYRVGGTVAGSRFISKALQDPAVSLFGRYHMGIFNTYGNIIKKLVAGSGSQRVQAIGQLMVAGAMAYGMYPLLDKAAQAITGNPHATFGRRGFSALPYAVSQLAQGKKDLTAVTPSIFTPSMPLNAFLEGIKNRDYTGKHIVEQGDLRSVKGATRAAGQEAEFAAQNLVSPYSTVARASEQPNASVGSVAKKVATSTLGIKDPTQREIAYNNKLIRENKSAADQRFKRPHGLIESTVNKVFGR